MSIRSTSPTLDPANLTDHAFDLSAWLNGDTIVSGTVTASPSGLTVATPSTTTTSVRVWISGRVAGVDYILACTALTNGCTVSRAAAGEAAGFLVNCIAEAMAESAIPTVLAEGSDGSLRKH